MKKKLRRPSFLKKILSLNLTIKICYVTLIVCNILDAFYTKHISETSDVPYNSVSKFIIEHFDIVGLLIIKTLLLFGIGVFLIRTKHHNINSFILTLTASYICLILYYYF